MGKQDMHTHHSQLNMHRIQWGQQEYVEIFRGLKFEPSADIGEKGSFRSGTKYININLMTDPALAHGFQTQGDGLATQAFPSGTNDRFHMKNRHLKTISRQISIMHTKHMKLNRITLLFFIFLMPCNTEAFERYNNVVKYDKYFSKYSKRFFGPAFDWHYFKAQAIAESRLKPTAKSQVGALGIMQIMPRTFKEISKKHPYIKGSREQPRWNIAAGIYYDRQIWNTWKAERPLQDRINFTFGSYNAGKGNILKAQKIAENKGHNPNLWQAIERTLPTVTGKRSQETIGYIRKIRHIKTVLE